MCLKPGKLLSRVNAPSDLKSISPEELVTLCGELRQFIIDSVSLNPGHFGSSLGVVELAVALHKVFDTPHDRLIWDVGHQAYAHKILTGRRDLFHTNRQKGGISGFPLRQESIYDAFGTGHASTSISAALGMAIASWLKKENRHHIAVIGDGSLGGGMALEALNHCGATNADVLVVLNDNGISIDDSVGALKEYLTGIPVSKQSNLFESLKIKYYGPVDGHDVVGLTRMFNVLKQIPGPKLLHVITVKGKGYAFAEKDQRRFHAPGVFNIRTGERKVEAAEAHLPPKYQEVFGETLVELARSNERIVGVTPAMPSGCSMDIMMGEMPHRTFDVGIAEQHAVTFSAGLASEGLMPFCNIYSTFFQRAYDQLIHDVAIQGLSVVFCLDRAGLVGEDGVTHHGVFDLSFLRHIPGLIISAPMNEEELRNLMYTAQQGNRGPFVIRYPRGHGVLANWRQPFCELLPGVGRQLKEGKDVAVVALGHVGNAALEACWELEQNGTLSVACYDLRYLKPLDEALLHRVFQNYKCVVTVEDNVLSGGMGSALLEFMADGGYNIRMHRMGIPDRFIHHGRNSLLHKECGIDRDSIVEVLSGIAKTLYLPNHG